jgi:serine/threonine protein kinase
MSSQREEIASGSYGQVYPGISDDYVEKKMPFETGAWIREIAFGVVSKELKCQSLLKLEAIRGEKDYFGVHEKICLTYPRVEKSLSAWLKHAPIDKNKFLQVFFDVALAVRSLHQHNWVHGDISSSNVMVDKNERGVLIDYSATFKVLFHEEKENKPLICKPWTSWGFAAPSCWKGRNFIASPEIFANEVWSLGALLLKLFGQIFMCRYQLTSDTKMYEEYLQRMSRIFETISGLPAEWILKSMDFDPKKRWNARELVEAIFQYAKENGIVLLQWGDEMPDELEEEIAKSELEKEGIDYCPVSADSYMDFLRFSPDKRIQYARDLFRSFLAGEYGKRFDEEGKFVAENTAYACASWVGIVLMCNNHAWGFDVFRYNLEHRGDFVPNDARIGMFFDWLIENWRQLFELTKFEGAEQYIQKKKSSAKVISSYVPISKENLEYGLLPAEEWKNYLRSSDYCQE